MRPDLKITDSEGNTEEVWANDLVKEDAVYFQGWQCGIGLESIEIRSDGTLYRGTCKVGGPIGHVDDEEWNLPDDYVTCTKLKCTCVADLKSTRVNVEKSNS